MPRLWPLDASTLVALALASSACGDSAGSGAVTPIDDATDAAIEPDTTVEADTAVEPDAVDNTTPRAIFTVAFTPGGDGRTFTFDASESNDPDDPPGTLRFQWDWETTGQWTAPVSNPMAVHTFPGPGNYTVTLRVIDIEGDTGEATRFVKVVGPHPGNTEPVAAFDVTPEGGTTATVFAVDASASHDAEDPASALSVRWDFEGTGEWTEPTTDKTASHTFTRGGTYVITLEVTDTGGLQATATREVTVASDTAPVLDQQQLLYNGGTSARTLHGYKVWQSFTAGITGTLVEIDMGFFNAMSGYALLEVRAGDGSAGAVLASQRVPVTAVDGGVSWNAWTVSVPITAGELYTFEVTPEAATLPDPYGVCVAMSNPYPRGTMGLDDPSGSYRTDFDLVFKTYVSPAP